MLNLCLTPGTFAWDGPALRGRGTAATGLPTATDSKLNKLDQHPAVSLDSVNVHVRLLVSEAVVECTCKMYNEGRATTVSASLPVLWADGDFRYAAQPPLPAPQPRPNRDMHGLNDYELSLNGKAQAWNLYYLGQGCRPDQSEEWLSNIGQKQWLASELRLSGHGVSTIKAAYRCPYETIDDNDRPLTDYQDTTFAFQLSTGGNWHGPVHVGHVEIECAGVSPEYLRINHPERFHRTGNSFIWAFKDLKPGPDDDIVIVTNPAHKENIDYLLYPDRWYNNYAPCTAQATSELTEGDKHFAASNLTGKGGLRRTPGAVAELCWAEGVEGDGIGESVTLTLKKPSRIDGFTIRNGFWQKGKGMAKTEEMLKKTNDWPAYWNRVEEVDKANKKLFQQNNRVSRLEVSVDDHPLFVAEVPDSDRLFFVRFPNGPIMAHKVNLTIAGVYHGSQFHDTCIASIGLREVLSRKPAIKEEPLEP